MPPGLNFLNTVYRLTEWFLSCLASIPIVRDISFRRNVSTPPRLCTGRPAKRVANGLRQLGHRVPDCAGGSISRYSRVGALPERRINLERPETEPTEPFIAGAV